MEALAMMFKTFLTALFCLINLAIIIIGIVILIQENRRKQHVSKINSDR